MIHRIRQEILTRLPGLFRPVDNASLVFLRIAFGFLMIVEVWRYLDHGWIARYFIRPDYVFPFTGFEWVRPWGGDGMYLHFYVLGLLALAIMVGFMYRLCAVLFFLGFTYVFLLDQTRYLNHFYLVVWVSFLMIWISPHRSFSVDARLWPKKAGNGVPAWMLYLMQAQMGFVYFFGGIAKINRDWLAGRPLDEWLAGKEDIPIIGLILARDGAPLFFAWSGLLIDLLAAPLLLWRRTRVPMFLVLILFHFMNNKIFNIGIFPWLAAALTTLFLDPGWPRRIFNWPGQPPEAVADRVMSAKQWAVVAALACFALLHIYLPLRHHLFSGNVNWTEEGHYFSWRMKLRDKSGSSMFFLENPVTGKTWFVRPKTYLTNRQIRKMQVRPHMVHRFAKFIARKAREEGHEAVIVRARVQVSLNGRPLHALVDPRIDLAAEPYRPFASSPWITAFPRDTDKDLTPKPR